MAWFKVRDGRVLYATRIDRQPYVAWLQTREGTAAVGATAAGLGFRLFGRARAARKKIWRELDAAARSAEGRSALQAAAVLYTGAIAALAYAPSLPRVTVALRRVVVLPRTLVAARSREAIAARLSQCPSVAAMPAAQRNFLCDTVLTEIDAAIRVARPSLQRPLHTPEEWVCIGADVRFKWIDPYWSGPAWSGHWIVYEQPRTPMSRRLRKEVECAALELQAAAVTLPRDRRQALVKLAAGVS
jgi:hypothetical protein